MAQSLTCPVCRQMLPTATDAQAPWRKCPRCGADVLNPAAFELFPTVGAAAVFGTLLVLVGTFGVTVGTFLYYLGISWQRHSDWVEGWTGPLVAAFFFGSLGLLTAGILLLRRSQNRLAQAARRGSVLVFGITAGSLLLGVALLIVAFAVCNPF